MKIKTIIAQLLDQVNGRLEAVEFLLQNEDKFENLPYVSLAGSHLDFDNLEHPEIIAVLRTLGGKWKKSKASTEGRIDYERKVGRFMTIRCWNGKPPPSCRMVEVEVDVPEEIIPAKPAVPERRIPAHKKTIIKMVCSDHPEPVVSAIASKQPINGTTT